MLFYYIIACAKTRGKQPYKSNLKIDFTDSYARKFSSKVTLISIVVKYKKQIDNQCYYIANDWSYCYHRIYEIYNYSNEEVKFYYRFTPTENYNANIGYYLYLYQSDLNGNFIKDISGIYPEQFSFINAFNKVFSDLITIKPYYVLVGNINSFYHPNFVGKDKEDNVFFEISDKADFSHFYQFKLRE